MTIRAETSIQHVVCRQGSYKSQRKTASVFFLWIFNKLHKADIQSGAHVAIKPANGGGGGGGGGVGRGDLFNHIHI